MDPRAFGNPLVLRPSGTMAVPAAMPGNCTFRPCNNRGRLRCSRCKAWYCSQFCQFEDWQDHRLDCMEPPPLEFPDGTLVRPHRPLRRPDARLPIDEATAAPALTSVPAALATPTTVTASAVTDPERKEEAKKQMAQLLAEEKVATKTNSPAVKAKQEDVVKPRVAEVHPEPIPTKAREVQKTHTPSKPQEPPKKATEQISSKKVDVQAAEKKTEVPVAPPVAKSEPKASPSPAAKVEPKVSPAPAKVEQKKEDLVVANGTNAAVNGTNGTLQEEDEMLASCVLDAVEGSGCDVTIMVEAADPEAKFSPGDAPCLVSYEELGVTFVLEEMQEAWKERVKTEKPLAAVKPGQFVIFSKNVPDEGLTFVRAIVLAVNPKGDRINALDIDSGYSKKADLTSVYRMRPEDKEQPGLGARLRAVSKLNSTQEAAVNELLQEGPMQPMKVDKLESGEVKGFLRTEEGKRICEYQLIPWYDIDSRVGKLMGYEVNDSAEDSKKAPATSATPSQPAPPPVTAKGDGHKSEEEVKMAKMRAELEAKKREMEELMAKLSGGL